MIEDIRKMIFEIIERYEEEGSSECEDEIEKYLQHHGIEQYKISIDNMYGSPGYDVYSVSVALIKDGKLELIVSSIDID